MMPKAENSNSKNTISSSDRGIIEFPSPPWVNVEGVANFRDIGGYSISTAGLSGKSVRFWDRPITTIPNIPRQSTNQDLFEIVLQVRRNLIFRSAEPGKITPQGKCKVSELGIRKIYDLRSVAEFKRLGSMVEVAQLDGVERIFIPVHQEVDYSPEMLARRYQQYMSGDLHTAYTSILHGDPTAYRTIFSHLLQTPTEPLLIHCTAGKDRTGIVCAMILLLAGVSDDIIAREYALTTPGLAEIRERIIEYLMKDKQSLANGGRAGAENMLSSKPETMLKFLEILRKDFGGVGGYLSKACGFNPEEIERIRQNVVCDDEPCCRL